LNCSIHSSKKHRQYESNTVNNNAAKHSLCPGNGVCLTLTRPRATQGTDRKRLTVYDLHLLDFIVHGLFVRLFSTNVIDKLTFDFDLRSITIQKRRGTFVARYDRPTYCY